MPDRLTDSQQDLLADEPQRWPVQRSEDVMRGSAPFAVRRDLVVAPSGGEPFWRVVVEHPGAVVVLAVDDQERAVVLQQYRHAAGRRFVELPAGLLDAENEEPVTAAQRELLEEAGIVADSWEEMLVVHNSPGFTDERYHLFLARDLREEDRGDFVLEHEEADMTVRRVPVADLLDGISAGRLTDGPLVLALTRYALLSSAPVSPSPRAGQV